MDMIIWSSSSIYTRVIQKSSSCSRRELSLNLTLNQKWSPVSKPNHSSSFSFFFSPSLPLLNQTRYFFFNSHLHTQSRFNFSFSSAKKTSGLLRKPWNIEEKIKLGPFWYLCGPFFSFFLGCGLLVIVSSKWSSAGVNCSLCHKEIRLKM